MAPELVKRGHEVFVITGFPSYPFGKIYPAYRWRLVQFETIKGVKVLRLPVFPDHSRSVFKRSLYYLSVALTATFVIPFWPRNVDVAFVSSPPITLGLPAVVLRWLRRVPFVYDVQDLYPESLPATGLLTNPFLLGLVDRLQRFNLSRANRITVISEGFHRNISEKGCDPRRIVLLRNWLDEESECDCMESLQGGQEHDKEKMFRVVYAGNIGLPQHLVTVIEAAEKLQSDPCIQIHLVGDGVERKLLQKMASDRQLKNVIFVDRVPPDKVAEIYRGADALLVQLRNDPVFSVTVPSKTISYLSAGKPLIAAVAGEVAQMITEAGAGLACTPEDPSALAEAIASLRRLPARERFVMGKNARKLYDMEFSREMLIGRTERVLVDTAREAKEAVTTEEPSWQGGLNENR
jgi:colanic acid biosynthesis glycosyl transferase WcaI